MRAGFWVTLRSDIVPLDCASFYRVYDARKHFLFKALGERRGRACEPAGGVPSDLPAFDRVDHSRQHLGVEALGKRFGQVTEKIRGESGLCDRLALRRETLA